MKEVVKNEVFKLLYVRTIYLISNSKLVCPIEVVLNKFKIFAMKKVKGELIPAQVPYN